MDQRTKRPPDSSTNPRAAKRRQRREAERRTAATRRNGIPLLPITLLGVALGLIVIGFIGVRPQASPVATAAIVTTPVDLADGRALGSASAPVTLDVWSDFQCPYCRQFWLTTEPSLVTSFVRPGLVRIEHRDDVFIGQESLDAAVADRCAAQQGKFWPYHDLLYANQGAENSGAFSSARLAGFATDAGLDVSLWSACLKDPTVQQAVEAETQQATAAGVTGTPTIFLNGTKLPSFDFVSIAAAIEAVLPSAGATGTPVPSSTQ